MDFTWLPKLLSKTAFYEIYAPFGLVFLIAFGLFLRYKPFGDWSNNNVILLIYGILSFLIGLFVMLFALNVYIEMFLAWVIGRGGIILILILMALLIAAFLKGGENLGGE